MSSTEVESRGEIAGFQFKDYPYIGFDLDHTLVRYHIRACHELIYELLVTYLTERLHYDAGLFQTRPMALAFAVKGTIIDSIHGNVVLLDRHCRVSRAYHGWGKPPLSAEALAQLYPDPVPFTGTVCDRFFVLSTYFITTWAQLYGILVDDMDARCERACQAPAEDDYAGLLDPLKEATGFHLRRWDEGGYFPAIAAHPEKYLRPNLLKGWILALRRHSRVFVCTNSLPEYTELLLRWSFGDDWDTVFDLVLTHAQKPERTVLTDLRTTQIEYGRFFSGGCAAHLIANLKRLDDVPAHTPIKVLYAGDHIESDCLVPLEISGHSVWKTIAIVEEMEDLELDFPHISLHPNVSRAPSPHRKSGGSGKR